MGKMKTLAASSLLSLTMSVSAAAQDTIAMTFAGCVGRFSAQMEHAWLMGSETAEDHQSQRHLFLTLLDATAGAEVPRDLLAHRIAHKRAQSILLTQASFGVDARRKKAAERQAMRHLNACKSLVLGS